MASITCHNVTKVYQDKPAVKGIDVEMPDGEFVVLVGPSGCGKSTLLRMIAGLEDITDGEVRIGNEVVNEREPKDRNIAMVFQNYALYPHMNVYDNMAYGLKNRRMPKDEIAKRIDKAVDILHLEPEMLKRKPRQLSGGQRQRVAIGRAIVREPQAFLFDEPLSNLDAKLRTQMRVEIKRLHELLGVTTVYVTHDQVEAMTLAQRLVVMHDGQAEQVGTAQEIYRKPATTFVATFIGSPAMNMLDGHLVPEERTIHVGDALQLLLPDGASAASRDITVGIRPEHMAPADPSEAQLHLPVELVENLGADVLVHGHIADKPFVARVPGDTDIDTGDMLPLRVTGQPHLFDAASGKRIDY